jgi:hypothetical protein
MTLKTDLTLSLRDEALEEAARVADDYGVDAWGYSEDPMLAHNIAAAIRALKTHREDMY